MTDPATNELPGFRGSDPSTSRTGAIDAYPRSGSDRYFALDAVWRLRGAGGATYEEVISLTGNQGAWKRLSELKKGGWIVAEGTRKVSTGSQAAIYFPTLKAWAYRMNRQGGV